MGAGGNACTHAYVFGWRRGAAKGQLSSRALCHRGLGPLAAREQRPSAALQPRSGVHHARAAARGHPGTAHRPAGSPRHRRVTLGRQTNTPPGPKSQPTSPSDTGLSLWDPTPHISRVPLPPHTVRPSLIEPGKKGETNGNSGTSLRGAVDAGGAVLGSKGMGKGWGPLDLPGGSGQGAGWLLGQC